jgi:hypothetical protein
VKDIGGKAFAVLLIGLFVAAIIKDIRVPLWLDEFLTLYASEQPTIPDVIGAIREGADSQPPLYDLIVRSLHPVVANDALRVRLPAALGLFLMCACVFAFVRKHFPPIYAALAAIVALRTTWNYAYEGRTYGLVLGCVSLAFLCWQRAAETGQRRAVAGMGISLTAAIALHYSAVTVLFALFAGEFIRWRNSRKLSLPILSALAIPPLILIPHLSLIQAGKPFVKYFWSKATAATFYGFYIQMLWPVALVIGLSAVCSLWLTLLRFGGKKVTPKPQSTMPAHEWWAVLVLLLLPEFVILMALLTVKVFVNRYVLSSMIGASILLAVTLYRVTNGSRAVAAIVSLPLLMWSLSTISSAVTQRPTLLHEGFKLELSKAPADPKPIVFFEERAFMELWFYSAPGLRDRFVYLVDPELERYYTQTDTNSLTLLALRRRVPLNIVDYHAFIAANPNFLVAGDTGEWIVPHLRHLNYLFIPLAHGLYEVRAPGS